MPPVTTLEGAMTYHYGENVVELLPMVPARTYGDIVANLPQHRIMFVGDIGFFHVVPWCQNAHPSNWIEVCNRIDGMDVEVVVPGHGPLGGRAELADIRDYLALLKEETRRRYDARMTAGAALNVGDRLGHDVTAPIRTPVTGVFLVAVTDPFGHTVGSGVVKTQK